MRLPHQGAYAGLRSQRVEWVGLATLNDEVDSKVDGRRAASGGRRGWSGGGAVSRKEKHHEHLHNCVAALSRHVVAGLRREVRGAFRGRSARVRAGAPLSSPAAPLVQVPVFLSLSWRFLAHAGSSNSIGCVILCLAPVSSRAVRFTVTPARLSRSRSIGCRDKAVGGIRYSEFAWKRR